MAYRIQLSASSKIYHVFHVSFLKAYHGPTPFALEPLPPMHSDNYLVVEPLTILDWKWDNCNTPPIQKVLVQWTCLTPDDTTWEEWDSLHTSYNLGDKVVLSEEGANSNPALWRRWRTRMQKTLTYLCDYA